MTLSALLSCYLTAHAAAAAEQARLNACRAASSDAEWSALYVLQAAARTAEAAWDDACRRAGEPLVRYLAAGERFAALESNVAASGSTERGVRKAWTLEYAQAQGELERATTAMGGAR